MRIMVALLFVWLAAAMVAVVGFTVLKIDGFWLQLVLVALVFKTAVGLVVLAVRVVK